MADITRERFMFAVQVLNDLHEDPQSFRSGYRNDAMVNWLIAYTMTDTEIQKKLAEYASAYEKHDFKIFGDLSDEIEEYLWDKWTNEWDTLSQIGQKACADHFDRIVPYLLSWWIFEHRVCKVEYAPGEIIVTKYNWKDGSEPLESKMVGDAKQSVVVNYK